jgi:hypothetical protein
MPSRRDIETSWRQKEATMTMLSILAIYVDLNIKEEKLDGTIAKALEGIQTLDYQSFSFKLCKECFIFIVT